MTASGEAPQILLRHHLKELKLPIMSRRRRASSTTSPQCTTENVGHVHTLTRLIELESPGGQRLPAAQIVRACVLPRGPHDPAPHPQRLLRGGQIP
jgi:hypothetical protein